MITTTIRKLQTIRTATLRRCATTMLPPTVRLTTPGSRRSITYELPDKLVAIHPSSQRDESRLLSILPPTLSLHARPSSITLYEHAQCVYNNFDKCPTKFGDFQFQDVLRLLPKKCHVVMNESMVLSARLVGALSSTDDNDDIDAFPGTFEVLLLSPADDRADPDALLRSSYAGQVWRAMIRSDVVKVNDIITLQQEKLNDMQSSMMMTLRVTKIHGEWIEEDENDGVEVDVEFLEDDTSSSSSTSSSPPEMEEILRRFGTIPIPPYLNRDAVPDDDVKYQTVYAKKHGSVAAPTAGLHFSNEMMTKLHSSSRSVSKVTLHVGAGTFKPVDGDILNHAMHRESWEISKDVVNSLVASLSNDIPIVPVGTTSVRVLESLYWMGARNILQNEKWYQGPPSLTLSQWEPRDLRQEYEKRQQHLPLPARALESLLWEIYPAAEGSLRLSGTTEICIAPGHQFQVVDGIITNFHQSKSTLMHLTAAVLGGEQRLLQAYDHAIQQEYRFLSFGDACFMVVDRDVRI